MRISNNFNQNQSFKAIQVSDRVESVIDELLEEESGFKKSFKKNKHLVPVGVTNGY